MLSRVAERIYWLGRQIERAENTARLLRVYTRLLLDLPRDVELGWEALVTITGNWDTFSERGLDANEDAVVEYLLTDVTNGSSIAANIAAARENARTTREVMPAETWVRLNDLHLFFEREAEHGLAAGRRHVLLSELLTRIHAVIGMLDGGLSRGPGQQFFTVGRMLERADMTTRIVDAGTATLRPEGEEPDPFDEVVWTTVLRSLDGYQMYRRHVRRRINARDAAVFLLTDPLFPRSVRWTLEELVQHLELLPRHRAPLERARTVRRQARATLIDRLGPEGVHELLDELQSELGGLHDSIREAWFPIGEAA